MIIISQDKDIIINFDNIKYIEIEAFGTHQKGKKIYKLLAGAVEGYTTVLGKYSTEERAKEVLKQIYNVFSVEEINDTYEKADLLIKLIKIARYQMPEQ